MGDPADPIEEAMPWPRTEFGMSDGPAARKRMAEEHRRQCARVARDLVAAEREKLPEILAAAISSERSARDAAIAATVERCIAIVEAELDSLVVGSPTEYTHGWDAALDVAKHAIRARLRSDLSPPTTPESEEPT